MCILQCRLVCSICNAISTRRHGISFCPRTSSSSGDCLSLDGGLTCSISWFFSMGWTCSFSRWIGNPKHFEAFPLWLGKIDLTFRSEFRIGWGCRVWWDGGKAVSWSLECGCEGRWLLCLQRSLAILPKFQPPNVRRFVLSSRTKLGSQVARNRSKPNSRLLEETGSESGRWLLLLRHS